MTVQGTHLRPRPEGGRLALRLGVLWGLAAVMVASGGPGSMASPVVLAGLLLGARAWGRHPFYVSWHRGLVPDRRRVSIGSGGPFIPRGRPTGAWRVALGAATVAIVAGLTGGAAAFAADEPDDGIVTGAPAAAARAAATAAVGGQAGRVERDHDDGAAYEVEVTRTDGTTVEVRLAADYVVVAIEGDSDAEDGGED